jgi:hypothetical protein
MLIRYQDSYTLHCADCISTISASPIPSPALAWSGFLSTDPLLCVCSTCIGAQDPYCGWDMVMKKCTSLEESLSMTQWEQSISTCPVGAHMLWLLKIPLTGEGEGVHPPDNSMHAPWVPAVFHTGAIPANLVCFLHAFHSYLAVGPHKISHAFCLFEMS